MTKESVSVYLPQLSVGHGQADEVDNPLIFGTEDSQENYVSIADFGDDVVTLEPHEIQQYVEGVSSDSTAVFNELQHEASKVADIFAEHVTTESFTQAVSVMQTISSSLLPLLMACGPFCVHSMGALLGGASSSASLGAGGLFPSLGLGSWATGSTESPKGTGVESSPSSLGTRSTRLSHEKGGVSTGILELFCLGLPGLCDALIPNSLHAD